MKKTLLGAVALMVLIALFLLGSYIASNKMRSMQALRTGHAYLADVYQEYQVVGEHCQGLDTDGDGYVSCDFRLMKEGTERVVNLQCPTLVKSFLGSSCKESRYPTI